MNSGRLHIEVLLPLLCQNDPPESCKRRPHRADVRIAAKHKDAIEAGFVGEVAGRDFEGAQRSMASPRSNTTFTLTSLAGLRA
jgi:hypothetical protein